jgi:hypothetical protein
MAITLGTVTKSPAGFTGTLKNPQCHRGSDHRPGRQDLRQQPRLPDLRRSALRDRRRLEPGRQIERRDLCEPQDRMP